MYMVTHYFNKIVTVMALRIVIDLGSYPQPHQSRCCLHTQNGTWCKCKAKSNISGAAGPVEWLHMHIWAASSEFGTYRLCEQRRLRRACASAQSHQNLRCSLIQAVSQEEPSDRKPDPWPLWMAGHAQLKFVMMECWKTQICLTRHIWRIANHTTQRPLIW